MELVSHVLKIKENRLVGEDKGVNLYREQLKEYVDYDKTNIIAFPPHIEDISISFVQGMTRDIFSEINKDEFSTYFRVEGPTKIVDKFNKSIYF